MTINLTTKTLVGNSIRLEPIVSDHYKSLKRAANDERIWAYMPMKAYGPFFDDWFADSLAQHMRRTQLTYSICYLKKNDILGCIAYYDIDNMPQARRDRIWMDHSSSLGQTFYA